MSFRLLTVQDPEWQGLIERSSADIFYSTAYCQYVTEGTSHRPLLFLYEDELGIVFDVTVEKNVAVLPFFRELNHGLPKTPVDLASPDYNSPIIISHPENALELLRRFRNEMDQYCSRNAVVTEFVRFHPLSQSAAACARLFPLNVGSEQIYVDLREGYEHAYRNYRKGHKSAAKKGCKEGVTLQILRGKVDLAKVCRFWELYSETMQRNHAKSVYFYAVDYFTNLIASLGDRALLVESFLDGHLATSSLFVLGNKHVWFKYSAISERYRKTAAHTYMLDRMIAWACENRYEFFMLGGGFEPGDSIYMSKRGFSHLSAQIHHLKKVHNAELLKILEAAKDAYDAQAGRSTSRQYFPSYWLQ